MATKSPDDIKQSDEWQKAVDYAITDHDIERQEKLLGYMQAAKTREYIQTATTDNIRNFAHGTGDDNPLFCDPDYARGTRWGSVIAPGMMVGQINSPMLGDPPSEEIKALRKSLWKGVHVFVSGSQWNWYRPVFPGDTIYSYNGDETSEVKQSEFSGRSVISVRKDVKINQRGEVVAVYRILRVLTERKTAAKKGKYSAIEPATYTDEDIAKIDEVYASEVVRGSELRNFEDVQVGDSLGKMAKGPLTVTDVIVYHAGGYGFVPYAPTVGRLAHKNRKRIPAFYVKNEYGVPDVAQRLHWDPLWAQAIGNPMAYDYGVMRESYLWHYLNDWAGDDGIITHVHDEIRKFNYMGDVQTITGEVTGKREEGGQNLVDVKVIFTNQRGDETVRATATIALPKKGGIAMYPEVPRDLAEEAAKMMQRHWELSRKK
ncbi:MULTISPECIES: FAS1-like dehydratase domain-containing protein [Sphingobium]|jgi:acyl dehydratase|uniref:FAS1-like dehydratase domain-containing protein n=1 Tax=Sphingobium TaxID=165695 RepID=UPI0007F3AB8D|nr:MULTISPECIES: MaoC family dehydratase N-terminal domain-containing protein [Sphingobium]MBS48724.1 acyl dehydratase [Sphingobium sp.]MEE2741762.1 MaoC family dehydratase N-terminal domain-containing protein [Pseudomonadota bacterium]MCC4258786.1 MaoC family dehydratase N-terminal domain-containing protein [Sphingobium lactosutens]OAN52620.1 acyl dehydratase [Sphingobium sp. TCM1]HCW59379.1 acyl dehydratase [Sphingobium sp.]|tara:strand:- start:14972 stop:16261 length:1290 start_codon:yes stop_codon:yes gene_type:complete